MMRFRSLTAFLLALAAAAAPVRAQEREQTAPATGQITPEAAAQQQGAPI